MKRTAIATAVLVAGLWLASHGHGGLLVLALIVAFFVAPRAKTGAAGLAIAGTRRIVVRTHGGHGTKTAARHEAGHYLYAKKRGWRVVSAQIFPDGSGVTKLDVPANASVEELVGLDASGGIAAGTWSGCGSDLKYMKQDLKRVPAGKRAAAKRAGYALARRHVGGLIFDGGVSSTADKIHKKGRI